MTPDHAAEIALLEVSRWQREAFKREEICEECKGTGTGDGDHGACRECNGFGTVRPLR